jgi:predicted secreted hydrolase
MRRRHVLLAALGAAASSAAVGEPIAPRPLVFPQDHGAHPGQRTEWWYITGALSSAGRSFGFQVTFFRSRTDVPAAHPSRFAADQLVFAHAAVTDLAGRRLRHDQRVAREGFGIARAAAGDTALSLRDWTLVREGPVDASRYRARIASDAAGFALDLRFMQTQSVLLQGDAGWSRKGPRPEQASHYYSQPQLQVQGTLALDGAVQEVAGRAWLDHEWSEALLAEDAVGWDWIGMNLDDGGALTAFRLRRRDGSALWAGGSHRAAAPQAPERYATRAFAPDEVRFTPLRTWRSTASQATYPVAWAVDTPVGRFEVHAMLDDQELDSRGSTGAIYWEGISELRDASGRKVGMGYLEMTGYAAALKLR